MTLMVNCPVCLKLYDNDELITDCMRQHHDAERWVANPDVTIQTCDPVQRFKDGSRAVWIQPKGVAGYWQVEPPSVKEYKMTDAEKWLSDFRRGEAMEPQDSTDSISFPDHSRVSWNGATWVLENDCSLCPPTVMADKDRIERVAALKGSMPGLGLKTDSNKPRWSLLPAGTLTQVIAVLEFGAARYKVDNWQHVPDARRRYYDAAMRHIGAWWGGEKNDPDSGLPHLAHVVCSLLFLMWFDSQEKSMSDEEFQRLIKGPRAEGQKWMAE